MSMQRMAGGGGQSTVNGTQGGQNASVFESLHNVCSIPCSLLGAQLRVQHLAYPCILALCACLASVLPTFVGRGRYKVLGIRSCLWPVLWLWVCLLVSYGLFARERVFGFAWMLHSSAHVLAVWQPPERFLVYGWLQPILCLVGAVSIWFYAWGTGGPLSLICWRTGAQSQCGWSAHLVAVLGVDFADWLLSPVGAFVMGQQGGREVRHKRARGGCDGDDGYGTDYGCEAEVMHLE